MYYRRQDPIYGSVIDRGRSYSDILLNQKRRLESEGVVEYILGRSDPTHYVPPDLKKILRRWFLEDSVAWYWRYNSGPYPIQIHHGVFDDTVAVDNSRWWAKVMRQQEIPFDLDNFYYFETPTGEHKAGSLSNASRVAMATVLANRLGY